MIAPGGHLVLQVPVGQGTTAAPNEPEFHMDWTPVFWRFGFDLTERLREAGFETELLCTEELAAAVAAGKNPWPKWSGEFDVPGMLAGAIDGRATCAWWPTATTAAPRRRTRLHVPHLGLPGPGLTRAAGPGDRPPSGHPSSQMLPPGLRSIHGRRATVAWWRAHR